MPTAPTGLRERKKDKTRESLLDETRDLLEAMPPSKFTVEEICDGAFVSTRTFHRYFPSKVEALLDVCQIRPMDIDTSDHPEIPEPPRPDCLLAARCYDDLGSEWLGAMIARIASGPVGGGLPGLEPAAHITRQIIERGQRLAQEARS